MLSRALLWLLAALPLSGDDVPTTSDAPLPRDRQVLLDRHLRGLTPQGTDFCISRSRIRDIYVISDDRLLFRVTRNLVYENRLQDSCPGISRNPRAPVPDRETGPQLCAGDLMREVDDGATCTLGEFTAWRPAEPAAD